MCWQFPLSQEHKCQSDCESIGVCEIDTVPHSIEETFNGAHDQFQYTRVSFNSIDIQKILTLIEHGHLVYSR